MGLQYTSGAGSQGGSAGAGRYVVVRICGQTAGNPQLIDTEKKAGRYLYSKETRSQ